MSEVPLYSVKLVFGPASLASTKSPVALGFFWWRGGGQGEKGGRDQRGENVQEEGTTSVGVHTWRPCW